jgi:hypothetical protein
VSSRLVRGVSGRPLCVEVTVPSVGLDHGHRFRMLGDEIRHPGFGFTGEPTGRPPLPEEAATVRRHAGRLEDAARTWTDVHRAEARRLQAEGLSWSQVAERVCGDKAVQVDRGSVAATTAISWRRAVWPHREGRDSAGASTPTTDESKSSGHEERIGDRGYRARRSGNGYVCPPAYALR